MTIDYTEYWEDRDENGPIENEFAVWDSRADF